DSSPGARGTRRIARYTAAYTPRTSSGARTAQPSPSSEPAYRVRSSLREIRNNSRKCVVRYAAECEAPKRLVSRRIHAPRRPRGGKRVVRLIVPLILLAASATIVATRSLPLEQPAKLASAWDRDAADGRARSSGPATRPQRRFAVFRHVTEPPRIA